MFKTKKKKQIMIKKILMKTCRFWVLKSMKNKKKNHKPMISKMIKPKMIKTTMKTCQTSLRKI